MVTPQELNGRRIRVDYSVTDRPHAPTPGEYMGHRRSNNRDRDRRDRGDPYRESYRDRDLRRDDYDRYDRDRYDRYDRDRYAERYDRYADRDRDPYSRDGGREWRRRSPPPPARRAYSPPSRPSRRSFSRSPPPRGAVSPPRGSGRDYDLPPPGSSVLNGDHPRW